MRNHPASSIPDDRSSRLGITAQMLIMATRRGWLLLLPYGTVRHAYTKLMTKLAVHRTPV